MNSDWRKVTAANPCLICGKDHACKVSGDGAVAICKRIEQGAFKQSRGWYFHRLIETPRPGHNGNGRARPGNGIVKSLAGNNWPAEAERLQAGMSAESLAELASTTGVPGWSWAVLSPGWVDADDLRKMRAGGAGWAESRPDGAWVFAERSGDGRIVGLSLRARDGRKGAPAGGKRGLIVPSNLHQMPDPVLIVEGASDVATCCALGLAAVGRPNNRGGAEELAELLDGRAVLVVGERDGKPGGAWPGRDGAKAVAQQLAGRWGELVQWTLPPLGTKDVRDWLRTKAASGLNPDDIDAMKAAGVELLAALQAAVKSAKPERRTQADALVDLARAEYRLGVSSDGEAFAVPLSGPAVAMLFRGGRSGLRAALAKSYRQRTGKTPSASALADALVALEGMAQDAAPEPLSLRLAVSGEGVVLDLGDCTGRAVVATAGGWAVQAESPVLFRRTALTAALPEPQDAEPAALLELRELMNCDDETWPLVMGWVVGALLPDVPHPVLLLGGEQGTGKSSAARLIVGMVDPSTAPLRSEPRDAEQWAIAAAGSWAVCIDNVSRIDGWLSDAICKAVTGDGLVRRKLYTDSDLAVLTFRRCIILTSIDHGALRGDLGDRLLLVDLERIPDDQRRTERDLDAAYRAMRPRLLGALLSATARTLAALPGVKLDRLPRMADFAKVLAALDAACPELTGGKALVLFEGQRQRIAGEVVESDAVALAIVKLMEARGQWAGTAGELLTALTPSQAPKHWPSNGRALSGRLRRLRPALLAVGIQHDPPAETDKRRMHHIEKVGSRPPEPPENNVGEAATGLFPLGGPESLPLEPPGNRPAGSGVGGAVEASLGDVGDMGGTNPSISTGNGRERGEL